MEHEIINKNKPLSKEEVKGLLSLIEESGIINTKKTNASNNKLKTQEWVRIADVFNATIGTCRHNPQQLRMKWENLKKTSRKRSAQIQMERIKFQSGGGPPGYIPPDEILDRVATLLGSTGEGFKDLFGGDAESSDENTSHTSTSLLDTSMPVEEIINNEMSASSIRHDTGANITTPIAGLNKGIKRKNKKSVDDGRNIRNIAIAKYYNIKKMILECKLQNIMHENEKVKLENEKLKLEIKKLKREET